MSALVRSLSSSSPPLRLAAADLAMDHRRWLVPLPAPLAGCDVRLVDLDCDYVATWSIPGDVRIIARTFAAVLHGHGAS